jgi:hypothetical protein
MAGRVPVGAVRPARQPAQDVSVLEHRSRFTLRCRSGRQHESSGPRLADIVVEDCGGGACSGERGLGRVGRDQEVRRHRLQGLYDVLVDVDLEAAVAGAVDDLLPARTQPEGWQDVIAGRGLFDGVGGEGGGTGLCDAQVRAEGGRSFRGPGGEFRLTVNMEASRGAGFAFRTYSVQH